VHLYLIELHCFTQARIISSRGRLHCTVYSGNNCKSAVRYCQLSVRRTNPAKRCNALVFAQPWSRTQCKSKCMVLFHAWQSLSSTLL